MKTLQVRLRCLLYARWNSGRVKIMFLKQSIMTFISSLQHVTYQSFIIFKLPYSKGLCSVVYMSLMIWGDYFVSYVNTSKSLPLVWTLHHLAIGSGTTSQSALSCSKRRTNVDLPAAKQEARFGGDRSIKDKISSVLHLSLNFTFWAYESADSSAEATAVQQLALKRFMFQSDWY